MDVHCQHILFGGTADNGYARLLAPLIEDEAARTRIILLEGPPFAQELADLQDKFRTVSFDNIFRSEKLGNVKRRVSFRVPTPKTPPADYAAVAGASSAVAPASVTQPSLAVSRKAVKPAVLQNKLGQRVDSPLTYTQADLVRLSTRKLCNHFYLQGSCPYFEKWGTAIIVTKTI